MNSAIERLLSLRIEDVMNTQVVQISSTATMREAAAIFDQFDVTGAPVVDESGRCVGILSATDFAMRELTRTGPEDQLSFGLTYSVVPQPEGGPVQIESVPEDRVSHHMSPVVRTIEARTPILQAARVMCQEHIHRLVVLDQRQRAIGIVSSLDLVAAMVAAVEE